ncbi:MAG: hypothetical protein WC389_14945 [Lutibacter sp.]|jgi:hypothetical protein
MNRETTNLTIDSAIKEKALEKVQANGEKSLSRLVEKLLRRYLKTH